MLLAVNTGCGASTQYTPALVARGELTLQYHDRFELWAAGHRIAHGTTYRSLVPFVACVPAARAEAVAARESGESGSVYTGLGIGFGTLALGGLGGLAFQNKPVVLGSFIGGGILSGLIGIVFGALARSSKNDANGHAVDAMNFYNDELGSRGGSCLDPIPAGAAAPEPSTTSP